MILTYHKIHLHHKSPSSLWVNISDFHRQMHEIRNKQAVYLDDYDIHNPNQVVITFDDGYKDTLQYAAPILKSLSYPFEVFIIGNYIGGDSSWDIDKPIIKMCSKDDLKLLAEMGGRLQWHTRTHPKLHKIRSNKVLENELKVPEQFLKLDKNSFKWLAYPYGIYRDNSVKVARKFFKGAVSCNFGDDNDRFLLTRILVTDKSSFKPSIRRNVKFYLNQYFNLFNHSRAK